MSRGSLWSSTFSLDVGWAPAIIKEEEEGMGRTGRRRKSRKQEKKKDACDLTHLNVHVHTFTNCLPTTLHITEGSVEYLGTVGSPLQVTGCH